MNKATIQLETLSCPSCMAKIEAAVKNVTGVDQDNTKVMFNASKVKTVFDDAQTNIELIEKAIEDMGYPVIKSVVKAV
ncbi:heavy-metal-associated domain-containing protein [Aerococcaceae bacterium DSM 111022]|nr:heavy-metal-associated domain-containing protein [Aerococcaceae bacterium DSM 111022]